MSKFIIVSADLILDEGYIKEEFINLYGEFKEKINFLFVSNDIGKRNTLKEVLGVHIATFSRTEIRNYVTAFSGEQYFISLGFKDVDYYLAQNKKFIFLKGNWKRAESKAEQYGLSVSFSTLELVLEMIINHESFYYHLEVDEKTELFSILDPRTKTHYSKSAEQSQLISSFEKVLKNNSFKYRNILRLLFLIMITKEKKFKEIDYLVSYPSSTGAASDNIIIIEKDIRQLIGIKQEDVRGGLGSLFNRHASVCKSHYLEDDLRIPCDRHFDSIHLDSCYSEKLKGKVVGIIDDYTTRGTACEVARNLLQKAGVSKIYFITLGKFTKYGQPEYNFQDYRITGNIFTPGYSYELIDSGAKRGRFLDNSEEIKNLYRLIAN